MSTTAFAMGDVNAENLRYLSLESLRAATQKKKFCFACMDGDYPV